MWRVPVLGPRTWPADPSCRVGDLLWRRKLQFDGRLEAPISTGGAKYLPGASSLSRTMGGEGFQVFLFDGLVFSTCRIRDRTVSLHGGVGHELLRVIARALRKAKRHSIDKIGARFGSAEFYARCESSAWSNCAAGSWLSRGLAPSARTPSAARNAGRKLCPGKPALP